MCVVFSQSYHNFFKSNTSRVIFYIYLRFFPRWKIRFTTERLVSSSLP